MTLKDLQQRDLEIATKKAGEVVDPFEFDIPEVVPTTGPTKGPLNFKRLLHKRKKHHCHEEKRCEQAEPLPEFTNPQQFQQRDLDIAKAINYTKGDPGPEGPVGPIGPAGPAGPAYAPYVFPFLSTAWVVGAPNYTITILGVTHGKGIAPAVQVQQANGTDYYPISPGIVHIDSASGNITLEVDASLASQLFSGRVVIE